MAIPRRANDDGSETVRVRCGSGLAFLNRDVGSKENPVIQGEFGYGAERGGAGWYAYEAGGAVHIPDTRTGMVIFAISHGPIIGYNPDGSVAGVLDVEWMYETARANGAADHIKRHIHFTPVE